MWGQFLDLFGYRVLVVGVPSVFGVSMLLTVILNHDVSYPLKMAIGGVLFVMVSGLLLMMSTREQADRGFVPELVADYQALEVECREGHEAAISLVRIARRLNRIPMHATLTLRAAIDRCAERGKRDAALAGIESTPAEVVRTATTETKELDLQALRALLVPKA